MTMGPRLLDKYLILDADKGECPFFFLTTTYLIDDRHWVVEAAIKWSGYGTKVTGFDKVNILSPLAVEHRVKGQIEFIRGNLYVFLPFLSLSSFSHAYHPACNNHSPSTLAPST